MKFPIFLNMSSSEENITEENLEENIRKHQREKNEDELQVEVVYSLHMHV